MMAKPGNMAVVSAGFICIGVGILYLLEAWVNREQRAHALGLAFCFLGSGALGIWRHGWAEVIMGEGALVLIMTSAISLMPVIAMNYFDDASSAEPIWFQVLGSVEFISAIPGIAILCLGAISLFFRLREKWRDREKREASCK